MLVVPMDGRASVEVHFFIAQRYWCQVNDHLHFKASKCCDTYYNNKMNPRAQPTSGALLFLTLLQCLEVVKSSVQPFPSDFEGGLLFLHTGELCGKRRPWLKFCIIENRQEPFCFLDSFSVQKSLKAVSSRFQVILRGSSFSTFREDCLENEDPGRNFAELKILLFLTHLRSRYPFLDIYK